MEEIINELVKLGFNVVDTGYDITTIHKNRFFLNYYKGDNYLKYGGVMPNRLADKKVTDINEIIGEYCSFLKDNIGNLVSEKNVLEQKIKNYEKEISFLQNI